jgi:hypothetical protein
MARAAELALPALALTDHDALYGAAAFWRAAQGTGVKPLFGVELTMGGASHHLTLLAETDAGYASLCQLISAARLGSSKGQAQASWDDLTRHHRGLIALSGCRQGLIAQHLLAGDEAQALRAAQELQALFGRERFFIEMQQQLRPGDQRLMQGLLRLASRCARARRRHQQCPLRAGGRLSSARCADWPSAAMPPWMPATLNAAATARRISRARPRWRVSSPTGPTPCARRWRSPSAARSPGGRGCRICPASPQAPLSQQDYLARIMSKCSETALWRRAWGAGAASAGPRAGSDRSAGAGQLLPDRLGHRALRARAGHPLPGSRLGRQLAGGLSAGHHSHRSVGPRSGLRAFPLDGASGHARYRHRLSG